jgi:histone H3/H4
MGVMRRLDELFTQWPFQRLMRQMGHRRPGAQAAYEQTGTWP